MKKAFLMFLSLTFAYTLHAQLQVTSDGKVKIASTSNTVYPSLQVGNNQFGANTTNIGIIGSRTVVDSKSNIGVLGATSASSSFSSDKNYGVLGVVDPMNYTHGRNYGVSGMIGQLGNHYGGTGVYGTCFTYYYYYPTNIQDAYAGYFDGAVKVAGNFTATSMYTPAGSSLYEKVVSLNERGEDTKTLDKLLAMNVIEYNMKSRLSDELSDDAKQDENEELRKAYEYLKKEEGKMCARRHFGIEAEELQKIYPDLVLEAQDGTLAVNYVEMVPLLLRSIQELKQELDKVKGTDNSVQKARRNDISHDDEQTSGMDAIGITTGNRLFQNTPNPFTERTEIRFTLAENAQSAYICIFDMTGKMLRQIPVNPSMQSVTVNGYELSAGIYLYSLVVNGQEIDTKRMILSK